MTSKMLSYDERQAAFSKLRRGQFAAWYARGPWRWPLVGFMWLMERGARFEERREHRRAPSETELYKQALRRVNRAQMASVKRRLRDE